MMLLHLFLCEFFTPLLLVLRTGYLSFFAGLYGPVPHTGIQHEVLVEVAIGVIESGFPFLLKLVVHPEIKR